MTYDLREKVAFVTGGSNGIGKAIADLFLQHGCTVIVADVSVHGQVVVSQWQADGRPAMYEQIDVRNLSQLEKAVSRAEEQFGGIDILVNNAGVFPRATLEETTEELWDQIMDINLKGVYHTCKACVPALIRRGGGSIVNIGSLNTFGGTPELFAYSTSKGGIAAMTVNLARSLAKHKIRVNCVHPGWVVTEGEIEVQRKLGQPNDWVETQGSKLPLGRVQTPEDIAKSILFFASDAADQITGQAISVDGGLGFHY